MEQQQPITILKIDTSLGGTHSTTRAANLLLEKSLLKKHPGATVVVRDLAEGLPLIDGPWTEANNTAEEERTSAQKAMLAFSDSLIEELVSADYLLIGLPLYNFGVPAALKAWIDLIARRGKTFKYTSNGPVGLLQDRESYLVYASGGTPLAASFEFATPFMKQALSFVGIKDVSIVEAKTLIMNSALEVTRP